MNIQTIGSTRPRLWPPKALLASGPAEHRVPTLSGTELRRIVAEVIG